jgi:hypothetical protein
MSVIEHRVAEAIMELGEIVEQADNADGRGANALDVMRDILEEYSALSRAYQAADGGAVGVWHKDGPLAQIGSMAEWAERESEQVYPDRETLGKIARNLRAAADALGGG